jgi:hypothetical protein
MYADSHDLSKWGNELRQTFRIIAQAAGVPELDVHLLTSHSIPGANAGYIAHNNLLREHLRIQQEAINRKMMDSAGSCGGGEKQGSAKVWPLLRSRDILADFCTSMILAYIPRDEYGPQAVGFDGAK